MGMKRTGPTPRHVTCSNNPEQAYQHRCEVCRPTTRGTGQKRGRHINTADACDLDRFARAMIGQAVRDCLDAEHRQEAYEWLFEEADREVMVWRDHLCEAGGLFLEGIRQIVRRGKPDELKFIAATLLGNRKNNLTDTVTEC